jgi:hypothetical protein
VRPGPVGTLSGPHGCGTGGQAGVFHRWVAWVPGRCCPLAAGSCGGGVVPSRPQVALLCPRCGSGGLRSGRLGRSCTATKCLGVVARATKESGKSGFHSASTDRCPTQDSCAPASRGLSFPCCKRGRDGARGDTRSKVCPGRLLCEVRAGTQRVLHLLASVTVLGPGPSCVTRGTEEGKS